MANCPKCGYKLRMIDIKAECPKCGVNLLYYNHQERLAEDADKAEEEHIKFQPKIDRVKFAFIGTKLSIVRLVLLLVPIGVLFLPLAHVSATIPFYNIDADVSILNLAMDVVAGLNFDVFLSVLTESALMRGVAICYALSIIFIFLSAVFAVLSIPFDAVSCSPKGFKRNVTLSVIGIAFDLLSIITFFIFNGLLSSRFGDIYSGSIGIGAFLALIGFAAIIVINVLIKKQNAPVKYKDVSEYVERIANRKKEIAEAEAARKAANV